MFCRPLFSKMLDISILVIYFIFCGLWAASANLLFCLFVQYKNLRLLIFWCLQILRVLCNYNSNAALKEYEFSPAVQYCKEKHFISKDKVIALGKSAPCCTLFPSCCKWPLVMCLVCPFESEVSGGTDRLRAGIWSRGRACRAWEKPHWFSVLVWESWVWILNRSFIMFFSVYLDLYSFYCISPSTAFSSHTFHTKKTPKHHVALLFLPLVVLFSRLKKKNPCPPLPPSIYMFSLFFFSFFLLSIFCSLGSYVSLPFDLIWLGVLVPVSLGSVSALRF